MILTETLNVLRERGWVTGRALRSIHLTPYFTVVDLVDGSVGAAMSYYGRPKDLAALPAPTEEDPLLLDWLFAQPDETTTFAARDRRSVAAFTTFASNSGSWRAVRTMHSRRRDGGICDVQPSDQ